MVCQAVLIAVIPDPDKAPDPGGDPAVGCRFFQYTVPLLPALMTNPPSTALYAALPPDPLRRGAAGVELEASPLRSNNPRQTGIATGATSWR
jgi:hypothetical protein